MKKQNGGGKRKKYNYRRKSGEEREIKRDRKQSV
jgi:hypothetical protein